jgi:FkbM family methyltransferase
LPIGNRISELIEIALDREAIGALLSWPTFSLTSFRMVSGLARQGLIPATVIDVGANIGQFAVAAAKLFPGAEIHSIEPYPQCVERLRRNVCNLVNINVYPVAVGESEKEVDFHLNSHSHSSSILSLAKAHRAAFPGAVETATVPVRLTTLDRLFGGVQLRPPVLLKLDVQGYEAMTLRGGLATLKRVEHVILEASFKPMYEGETLFMDIVRLMERHGFRFSRPVGSLCDPGTHEVLQMDVLFERGCRSLAG